MISCLGKNPLMEKKKKTVQARSLTVFGVFLFFCFPLFSMVSLVPFRSVKCKGRFEKSHFVILPKSLNVTTYFKDTKINLQSGWRLRRCFSCLSPYLLYQRSLKLLSLSSHLTRLLSCQESDGWVSGYTGSRKNLRCNLETPRKEISGREIYCFSSLRDITTVNNLHTPHEQSL